MLCSDRGIAFVDLLVTTAALVVLSAMSAPVLRHFQDRAELRAATRYVSGRLHAARLEALRRQAIVSLRIGGEDEGFGFRLYVDADGDGVLQRDIDDGVDVPLDAGDRLEHHFAGVGFRIATDVPDIDGGRVEPSSDPIRIGPTRFVSFNPLGGCSSGTLFIAGSRGDQGAVRLLGQTGRIRALWFDRDSGQWREG